MRFSFLIFVVVRLCLTDCMEFFTLQLRFSRPLPVDIRLRRDSLRLYCAPAINLFIHHAEAITLDNRRADYPLVPSRHYPQHYDVFSVNSVVSQVQDMFRKKDLGRPVSTPGRAPVASL